MNALLETSLKAAASYDEALDYALNKHPVPLQPPQFVFVLSHVARMCDSQRLGWSGIHRLKVSRAQLSPADCRRALLWSRRSFA